MIIDWHKYISLLLPLRMRTQRMIELVRTLVWQVPQLASRFNVWEQTAIYKGKITASTIALEKLIEREFGVLATIEELDGQPTDFLVNVAGPVDEVRLKALIDQYKLAGRSYAFKLGAVVYTSEFTNHVCEDIIELVTAAWIDHVCEDDGVVEIRGWLLKNTQDQWEVLLKASRPVKSDLSISGRIEGTDGDVTFWAGDFVGTFPADASQVNLNVTIDVIGGLYYWIDGPSVGIDPASDIYYSYEYVN